MLLPPVKKTQQMVRVRLTTKDQNMDLTDIVVQKAILQQVNLMSYHSLRVSQGELGYGDPGRDPTPCRCLRGSWDMVTLAVTPLPAGVSGGVGIW
jgi:hypothetical protein